MRLLGFSLIVIMSLLFLVSPVYADDVIHIKGWSRMVPIIQDAAVDFMAIHPNVTITVNEEKNNQAIRELCEGTIDIVLSRNITDLLCPDSSIAYLKLVENPIGRTGVGIIVNQANPVSKLSPLQIQRIYKGEIKNWKEVGGEDTSIFTVGYYYYDIFSGKGSGARKLFFDVIMNMPDTPIAANKETNSENEIVNIVSENPEAIAYTYYLGIDPEEQYLAPIKTLALDINGFSVYPSVSSINDGTYPVFENLNLYTRESSGGVVKDFIDFLLGPAGQAYVRDHGQIPILESSEIPILASSVNEEISGPTTITQPGYYWLANDILNPQNPINLGNNQTVIINIQSHDVIIDGRGHTISGSDSRYTTAIGIGNMYKSNRLYQGTYIKNVTIQNIKLSNWYYGISGFWTVESSITNVTAVNNQWAIRFEGAKNIGVTKSVISNNRNCVFFGDFEHVTIQENFIENCSHGIWFEGEMRTSLPALSLKNMDMWVGLVSGKYKLWYPNKFSGNNNLISSNRISNAASGIQLYEVDHTIISNNSIVNSNYGITSINTGSNNTFTGNIFQNNRENTRYDSYRIPIAMVIFSVMLILLQSGYSVIKEFTGEQVVSRLGWLENILSKIQSKIIQIGNLSFIQVCQHPLLVCILSIAVMAIPYQYSYTSRIDLFTIAPFLFVGGFIIVSKELVRYFIARRYTISVAIKLWWFGVILTLATGFIFKSVFGQPLKAIIKKETIQNVKQTAIINLSGPLTGFFFILGFFLLYLQEGFLSYIGTIGWEMSVVINLVSFFPVSPLDGKEVYKWKKEVWAIIFFSFVAIYIYFIYITQIVPLFITIY